MFLIPFSVVLILCTQLDDKEAQSRLLSVYLSLSLSLSLKGKIPTMFFYLWMTLSLIAELIALIICDCITLISESILRENLEFISPDNIPMDSKSLEDHELSSSLPMLLSHFLCLGMASVSP